MTPENIIIGLSIIAIILIAIGVIVSTIASNTGERPEAIQNRVELELLRQSVQDAKNKAERERIAQENEKARLSALQTARLNKLSTFTIRHFIMHNPTGTYEDLLKRCAKSTHTNYYREVFEKEKRK